MKKGCSWIISHKKIKKKDMCSRVQWECSSDIDLLINLIT